jgi:soluble lytic murein transglycosylase-like protein
MQTRHQWISIVMGLALLISGAAIDLTIEIAHASDGTRRESDAAALRAKVIDVLEEDNPLLAGGASGRIADAVLRCEREHDLAPDLVLGVMSVESSLRVYVRSPKGAVGLMQVMPHMFEVLQMPGNVAHIEMNVEAGCRLLADNIRRLGEEDGISTYFWGSRIQGDDYLRKVQEIRRRVAMRLAAPDAAAAGRGRG